jgi:hypothetical protein
VGNVTVEEDGNARVIHFNPKDDGRIGDTVRNAAREDGATTDQVRDKVQAVLSADDRKPAALNTALGFDDSIRPDPLRGFEAAQAPHSIEGVGWRQGGDALSSKDAKFLNRIRGNSPRAVLVARDSGAYVISAPPAAPVQAFDLASATDAFIALTRDTPEAPVAVHLRGFDDRQAEGFMRDIDAHSEVRVSVGSTEEYVTPGQLEEILNSKYDWTRAELREEPKLVVAADGKSSEVQAALSIPAREAGNPSLLVRLRLTISNAIEFTQGMLTELGAHFRSVLLGVNSDDARVVARALVDELKKDKRFTTVQAQVQHDDKTVFYVQNREVLKELEAKPFAA